MEIRPILSALMRNKTGPILVAMQVALSLAILANALHIVNDRRAVAARPSGLQDEAATFYFSLRHLNQDTPEQMLAAIKRERLGNQPGLGEGERAAPRADPDRCSAHSPNSSRMARS